MDKRVEKSKNAIKKALSILMTEKDINDITISEISDRADLNRKTFYNCYSGIRDVLDEIENEITAKFAKTVEEMNFVENGFYAISFYESLSLLISEDMDLYETILNEKNKGLATKLVGRVSEIISSKIVEDYSCDKSVAEISALFITSGVFAVFQRWISSGREASIMTISETVSALVNNSVNGILTN